MKKLICALLALAIVCAALPAALAAYTDAQTVRAVQQALKEKGYYRGEADGVMNRATESAIGYYQERWGLRQSGQIDDELLSALKLPIPTDASPREGRLDLYLLRGDTKRADEWLKDDDPGTLCKLAALVLTEKLLNDRANGDETLLAAYDLDAPCLAARSADSVRFAFRYIDGSFLLITYAPLAGDALTYATVTDTKGLFRRDYADAAEEYLKSLGAQDAEALGQNAFSCHRLDPEAFTDALLSLSYSLKAFE